MAELKDEVLSAWMALEEERERGSALLAELRDGRRSLLATFQRLGIARELIASLMVLKDSCEAGASVERLCGQIEVLARLKFVTPFLRRLRPRLHPDLHFGLGRPGGLGLQRGAGTDLVRAGRRVGAEARLLHRPGRHGELCSSAQGRLFNRPERFHPLHSRVKRWMRD